MKIEFETKEILSEIEIREIAKEAVKEKIKESFSTKIGNKNFAFYLSQYLLDEELKNFRNKIKEIVNNKINDYDIDILTIEYHDITKQIIEETINKRKQDFIDKANEQINKILKEEDWKYKFLSNISDFLVDRFIEEMYSKLKENCDAVV